MKKTLSAVLALAILSSSPCVNAEPKNITSISAEQLSELESMHQHATDLLIKNDFRGALRAYSDILLAEPDDETAYTGLGQIYMVLGQVKKAHEAFKNALDINSNNEVALLGIQKIMDPDGFEGMTNRAQVEEHIIPKIDIAPLPMAKITKRFGPYSPVPKKKKPSITTSPTSHVPRASSFVFRPSSFVSRPSSLIRRPSEKELRLGLLNAQRIQMSLKNAGVYGGPVNGMFGQRTRRAIRRFQKMRGFKETGTTNNVTLQALLPYLAYSAH
jgi:tetratricopeptide (TPR) repeat protein